MNTSLVITTAALADPTLTPLSSGRQPHRFREYLLKCHILPQAAAMLDIQEVLVVGDFEDGEGYRYIPVPSVERSSIFDSLRKRQIGCAEAKGNWIIVQNDDHLLDPDFVSRMWKYVAADTGVVSPARRTRLRRTAGEALNSGSRDGYINGHTAAYRRDVLQRCPWDNCPRIFSYDVAHTHMIRDAGFDIVFPADVITWDCEYLAEPWR